MELVVGALVVLALIAILVRFGFRDASGQVRLPRIVDDSIGMWVVRRILGRPTDADADPFARFRRPSTVLGRRPGELGSVPVARRAPAPRAPPAVLRDAEPPDGHAPLPPAWSTVERRPSTGRAFGASILTPAPAPPTRSPARATLQYGVLFVVVAIGGLALGALAGLATGPNPASAPGSAAGSVVRGSSPAGSSLSASPR